MFLSDFFPNAIWPLSSIVWKEMCINHWLTLFLPIHYWKMHLEYGWVFCLILQNAAQFLMLKRWEILIVFKHEFFTFLYNLIHFFWVHYECILSFLFCRERFLLDKYFLFDSKSLQKFPSRGYLESNARTLP